MIVSRELRAPRENGGVLALPPLASAGRVIASNRQRLAQFVPDLLGRPWPDLLLAARRAAMASAADYFHHSAEPLPALPSSASLLLAGHQPELFHPGVWFKNFVLNALAGQAGAVPINLVVDDDTVKTTALRIPTWAATIPNHDPAGIQINPAHPAPPLALAPETGPHMVSVPYDRWAGEIPYEERTVRDEALFAALPAHAAAHYQSWNFTPLLPAFWGQVLQEAERTPLLGERFARGRRHFERLWGCHNLEVPISHLCRTEPFAWFACHLLTQARRFHEAYNDCLHVYRRQYGLRSRNHPVPDLAADGSWLEMPFWAWKAGQEKRGRLFVRLRPDALELRADAEPWPSLPFAAGRSPAALVRAWQDLETRGLKVRTRALTTTLFSRLLLADLFIHGIGGGKYDELTDEIIRRFYEREPPEFCILSATLLLPLPSFPESRRHYREVAQALRDTFYNPQRHLPDDLAEEPAVRRLVAEKQRWIGRNPVQDEERRQRFTELRRLTGLLRGYVNASEYELEDELVRRANEIRANEVLQRRDYAFCLYPEAELRGFYTPFLSARYI